MLLNDISQLACVGPYIAEVFVVGDRYWWWDYGFWSWGHGFNGGIMDLDGGTMGFNDEAMGFDGTTSVMMERSVLTTFFFFLNSNDYASTHKHIYITE